jgi:hypothetical protein
MDVLGGNINSLCGLLYCANLIANEALREREWSGAAPFNRYLELYEHVFDDWRIEEFVEGDAISAGFSDSQVALLRDFMLGFEALSKAHDPTNFYGDRDIVRTAEWRELSVAAKRLVDGTKAWTAKHCTGIVSID